jgi:hypothetical protein
VNRSRNAYAKLVEYANEYINEETELHLGAPIAKAEIKPKAPQAPQSAEKKPAAPVAETTLPNQTENLTISEFEIVPERQMNARKTQRRANFGFTLSPIITVRRPKQGK